eukprot:jgi/Psemu1/42185/gm1.42185_g
MIPSESKCCIQPQESWPKPRRTKYKERSFACYCHKQHCMLAHKGQNCVRYRSKYQTGVELFNPGGEGCSCQICSCQCKVVFTELTQPAIARRVDSKKLDEDTARKTMSGLVAMIHDSIAEATLAKLLTRREMNEGIAMVRLKLMVVEDDCWMDLDLDFDVGYVFFKPNSRANQFRQPSTSIYPSKRSKSICPPCALSSSSSFGLSEEDEGVHSDFSDLGPESSMCDGSLVVFGANGKVIQSILQPDPEFDKRADPVNLGWN